MNADRATTTTSRCPTSSRPASGSLSSSPSSRSRPASSAPGGTPPTASPARWPARARRWTSWASGRPARSPTRPASTRSPSCRWRSAGPRSRRSTGGAGAATDAFGGADGFAVGKDAPPEAVDFLAFITNEANQETWAANSGLPGQPGSRRRGHRSEHAGRARRAERGDVHPAVPRPVLHGRGRCADQRPDRAAVRRRDHAARRRRRRSPRRPAADRRTSTPAACGWEAPCLPPAGRTTTHDEHRHPRLLRRPAAEARRVWADAPVGTIALFLLPALALYGVFVLYPIVQSTAVQPVRLERPRAARRLRRARQLPPRVLRPAVPRRGEAQRDHRGAVAALQIPFALGLALLLNSRIRGRAVLRTLFFAPYVLSEVVTGVVWRQILRPDGLLDRSLDAVGASGLTHEWLADPDIVLYSLFFVISWKYFGFHMVILLAGLQQIPNELDEAAAIDGASRGRRSATSRCRCSARRSACRSSCRSSAPCSCSTSCGSPPRAARSAPRRRWRPTSTTSSARDCSATPAPCRS